MHTCVAAILRDSSLLVAPRVATSPVRVIMCDQVCVCVCARARVCACACARTCMCTHVWWGA